MFADNPMPIYQLVTCITGDPLHSRAACTQPCNVNTHSRAHCSPGARLCEQWEHGCVNNGARLCASARLCRGSPVCMLCCEAHRAGWLPSRGYPWRWPRITSQMCTHGRLACNWKTDSRGQWSRAWERSYYSYRRHATSNFVLAIPLNSWYGSIVSLFSLEVLWLSWNFHP